MLAIGLFAQIGLALECALSGVSQQDVAVLSEDLVEAYDVEVVD